jgi:hypothetical protein
MKNILFIIAFSILLSIPAEVSAQPQSITPPAQSTSAGQSNNRCANFSCAGTLVGCESRNPEAAVPATPSCTCVVANQCTSEGITTQSSIPQNFGPTGSGAGATIDVTPQSSAPSSAGSPTAQAQNSNNGAANSDSRGGLVNPLKADSVEELFSIVLEAAKTILGMLLVLALLYCGWLFIDAQGNEEKLKKARNAFMWTIVGGIVILGISGIFQVIQGTLNELTTN